MTHDLFADVRARADLPAIVAARVPDLRPRGGEFVGRCPFHDDRDPSFTVFQKGGEWRYHCFGCGAHGTAIDWLVQTEGLEALEAARRLARELGIPLPKEDPEAAERARAERARREPLLRTLELAARYYRSALQADRPEAARARAYLALRGLGPAVLAWGIGYAPAGYGIVRWLHQQGVPQEHRVAAGITRLRDGREVPHLRDRVVFPIADAAGRVVAFTGRALGDAQPKYMNTPETEVFKKRRVLFGLEHAQREIRRTGRAVLVEGPADAISLHLAGVADAVAVMGSALSEEQAELLVRHGCTDAVLVPDSDGRVDLVRVLRAALPKGLPVRVLRLPAPEGGGKLDPDALVRSDRGPWGDRPGADWLREALEAAPAAWALVCRELRGQHPGAQALAAAIGRELLPLWRLAPAGQRALLEEEAARELKVGKRALKQALGVGSAPRPAAPAEPPDPAADGPRLTDRGNALRLVRLRGEDLLWCERIGRWYVWDGRRWVEDWQGLVYRAAEDVIDALWQEAARSKNGHRGEIAAWALRSEEGRRIREMVNLARHHLPVDPDELDPDPWVINTPGGVVDLRTGRLGPHRRDKRCTRMTRVTPDQARPAALWERCLLEWMGGDAELVAFLRRLIGMTLIGTVLEHVLPIHHGVGGNGKSTFLGVLQDILGDYACVVPVAQLAARDRPNTGPTPEIARLKGARMATAAEPDEGIRLAEGLIKQLTGGDRITARYLHRDPIEFDPTHTLHLAVNHLPRIRGRDEGIWRRVLKVPWQVVIPPERRDRRLKDRLRDEAPGILAWAVRGCLEYQERGLDPPEAVRSATEHYRRVEDTIGRFIEECCQRVDGAWVYAGELYDAYRRWAEGAESEVSQTRFGRVLAEMGIERGRGARGRTVYRGLRLARDVAEREGEPPGPPPDYLPPGPADPHEPWYTGD